MWNSLEPVWQVCLDEAWAAYCAGSLPIGAAVLNDVGSVVGRGRNRILDREAEPGHLYGNVLAHAEVNALNSVDYTHLARGTGTLYTTTEPCPLCIGAARMVYVRAIHYASRDAAAGSVDLLTANAFMRRRPIAAIGPERPDLEALVIGLHVAVRLQDPSLPGWPIEAWERDSAAGVRLGHTLHKVGLLLHLCSTGADTETMVEALADTLANDNNSNSRC